MQSFCEHAQHEAEAGMGRGRGLRRKGMLESADAKARSSKRSTAFNAATGDPAAAARCISAHPMPAISATFGDRLTLRQIDGLDGSRSWNRRIDRCEPSGAGDADKSKKRGTHGNRPWFEVPAVGSRGCAAP